jgi:acetoacetyl-CoA synthetase
VSEPRWTPSDERVRSSAMHAFEGHVRTQLAVDVAGYDALHAWSVRDRDAFWDAYARWSALPFDAPWRRVTSGVDMASTRWFDGASLNVARALLGGASLPGAGREAIVAVDEAGTREAVTWSELASGVAAVQRALRSEGVGAGDRVAAFASNRIEAVVLFLACAASGAVFTSCSPDFGAEAALARFEQVRPSLLFASSAYRYGGRRFDVRSSAAQIAAGVPGLRRLVWLPAAGEREARGALGAGGGVAWSAWLRAHGGDDGAATPGFASLAFDHPLAVLYSSGTTGAPKAIVHRAGGVLLTHHKEHRLHCDVRPGDRVLYFTTLGWMMWNWIVSALAQGATLVLYDGSPAVPDALALWRVAERERVTLFGTGARYLHGLAAAGVAPGEAVDLSALRTVASTGSPLAPSGFAFVYERAKADVHLASISGGTDIVGCFALGVPTLPVFDGQLQRPGLGVDLAVYDDGGRPLPAGVQGELVCRAPLPSMPLGFWGDERGERYHAAYFERFDGVWHHGDLIERTPEGGVIVHGRSDATLNPGGVRIGTAELYRPLQDVPEVVEASAVGKRREDGEEVWLLLVLRDGCTLDAELEQRVKQAIRRAASPRHVPARVLQVPALPHTRSGKPMELAVRRLVNGDGVPNRAVMANPEACDAVLEAIARAT